MPRAEIPHANGSQRLTGDLVQRFLLLRPVDVAFFLRRRLAVEIDDHFKVPSFQKTFLTDQLGTEIWDEGLLWALDFHVALRIIFYWD
ncbi:hypothetical protein Y032_0363g3529 [Ancylostoma ceylanicum]|uniref:Uncharacterized protein n=1 Tax=Ancylostoma ceylanicum TaxID=53326 RepID=A0A016RVA9_9BILA|nr:hypothetical protein Y032_0363g3529 [Ancylostoma ceylanicum]